MFLSIFLYFAFVDVCAGNGGGGGGVVVVSVEKTSDLTNPCFRQKKNKNTTAL